MAGVLELPVLTDIESTKYSEHLADPPFPPFPFFHIDNFGID